MSKSSSLRFRSVISCKGAQFAKKAHMFNPMAPSDLTLSDIERSVMSLRFGIFVLVKEPSYVTVKLQLSIKEIKEKRKGKFDLE